MNKDKLMQAVMRLRDLDFKQSVELWGSKEISVEIAIINGIKLDDITSKHVLMWVTYTLLSDGFTRIIVIFIGISCRRRMLMHSFVGGGGAGALLLTLFRDNIEFNRGLFIVGSSNLTTSVAVKLYSEYVKSA